MCAEDLTAKGKTSMVIIIDLKIYIHIYVSSECSAQGHVLHCKRRDLGWISVKGRSYIANSGTKVTVLSGIEQVWLLADVLHPTLSLASKKTLKIWKDPRVTSDEVRRVDLANWTLWTASKFTTVIKYQFHQGFWADQRSEISIALRPYIYIYISSVFCTRAGPSLQALGT